MSATLLDKREERIRNMFGRIAPWYDTLNHLLSLNIDRSWRRRTTQLVPPVGTDPILDLCTGSGDLALAYDRAAGGAVPIVGADFCRELLVRAAAKTRKHGAAERVRFVEADAQRLPFANDQFQIVCVAFGLRNITDMDRGLAEFVRVTKPGGRVAVLEFSKPRHWLIRGPYLLFFRRLLPPIGQFLSRSPDSAYRYLPESVMQFPDYEALAARLAGHGLADVRFYPFTFGIATLYVGRKPE
ncbi:MAG: bifunctional demethylmenaquinone methyltransferase/2-methoxy-6-polyprenyl-1,4-benzoquinol methylase UbiE [Gemmataceae bacterium]